MEARALFEAWFDRMWRKRDLRAIDELRDDSAKSGGLAGKPLSNDELRAFYTRVHEVLAETEIVIDRFVERDGEVALSARFSGVTRDGKRVEIRGMGFASIAGGKIVEGDNLWDIAGFVAQIGGAKGTARTLADAIALLHAR